MPLENAFRVLDEGGVTCGSAAVVEYINHALLPERPLNYYISINAHNQRAFDMLMGAAVARSLVLRRRNARMPARIYAPCPPFDAKSLRDFLDFGFQNDDAVIRMRHILTAGDHLPNPPVGCALAPVMLEEAADYDALLTRLNAYSAVAHGPEWLARLRQEPLFAVCGVWQEERLLGELVLTGYGADRDKAKAILDQSHLTVCFGAHPIELKNKLNPNALDEAERQKAEDVLKQTIDEAEYLGSKGVTFLAGHWQEDTKEQAYAQLLKTRRALCSYAAEKNMMVEMEVFDFDMD